MESVEICAICLTAKTNHAKPQNCTHSFCLGCLERWNQQRDYCPLCRQPFTYIECHFNVLSNAYEVLKIGVFRNQNRRLLSRSGRITQPPRDEEIEEIVSMIEGI